MADEKREGKEVRSKFKYVEQFAIQEEKNLDEVDSPKFIETNYFGRRYLHQIARVIYEEYEEETPEVLKVDDNGNPVFKKVKKTREKMGEIGGWIERFGNLSQDGECWVHPNAYILGYASVTGDVQVYPKVEIGDSAKVTDKAELSGYVCIKDQAFVYGEAQLYGETKDDPVMVSNNARVCGRMTGHAKASGNAFVGADAEIADKGSVSGNAMVLAGYVKDYGEVYEDAIVDVGGDFGSGDNRPMVRDKAKVHGAAIVKGGSIDGESNVDGLALVRANVSNSTVGEVVCLNGDYEASDFVVRDSKILGVADFSEQGETGGGSRSEIVESEIVGNIRFHNGTVMLGSKVKGNVRWAGNLTNSNFDGNVTGNSGDMKALVNTNLAGDGSGHPERGCHVEGYVVNSKISSGVVKSQGMVADSTVDGGAVSTHMQILHSGITGAAAILGKVSNGSASGVVTGSIVNNGGSHATMHMYPDYHNVLVVLSKCGKSSHGHLVEIGEGESTMEDVVEKYEHSLEVAEQEMQDDMEELRLKMELRNLTDDERTEFEKKLQEYEDFLAKEVEEERKRLEEAKRKKKEAEEEAEKQRQEREEEERRYQDEMDRRDKEMADALDSNGVDYEYAKIGDNRIFS